MSDLLNNSFILSHSQTSGYDFIGNIERLIPEKNTQKWVASYISMLSEYASNPNYISQAITTKSYFVKDNYVVFLESYPKTDNRLFLERKVTVNSLKSDIDFKRFYCSQNPINTICVDKDFISKIYECLLCAFLSEKTTLYFLINSSDYAESLRNIIASFSQEILKWNSCVEILEKLPSIKASVAACRCIFPYDKTEFIDGIKEKSNYILVDLTADAPLIDLSISSPTYAQRSILYLLNHYRFDNIYYSIVEALNMYKISIENKTAFFNTICYLTTLNNFGDKIYEISMSAKEKEEINLMLTKGGLL